MSTSASETLLGLRLVGGEALADEEQPALRLEWASSCAAAPTTAPTAAAAAAAAAAGHTAGGALPTLPLMMTGPDMYLALKPAFNKFVASYAAPSKAGTPKDWPSHGSPLTFAHLLALAAPAQASQLLELLLRGTSGSAAAWAGLLRQELQMHAAIQAGSAPEVRRLRYGADTGYRLLRHPQHPLLLALSGAPLPWGMPGLKPASLHHLLSAFAWDEHAGEASFLLPAAAVTTAAGSFVTLCVLSSAGLEAVGVSQPLAKLESAQVVAGPWQALPWLQPKQLDLELVELALARAGSNGREGSGWRSAVSSSAASELVQVDLLSPGAIPADAKVGVAVAGGVLTVVITVGGEAGSGGAERGGRAGGGAGSWWSSAAGRSFSVDLPEGVVEGPAAARMSRPLGLLSCRVRRAAAD
jgi:hypothetical protein